MDLETDTDSDSDNNSSDGQRLQSALGGKRRRREDSQRRGERKKRLRSRSGSAGRPEQAAKSSIGSTHAAAGRSAGRAVSNVAPQSDPTSLGSDSDSSLAAALYQIADEVEKENDKQSGAHVPRPARGSRGPIRSAWGQGAVPRPVPNQPVTQPSSGPKHGARGIQPRQGGWSRSALAGPSMRGSTEGYKSPAPPSQNRTGNAGTDLMARFGMREGAAQAQHRGIGPVEVAPGGWSLAMGGARAAAAG